MKSLTLIVASLSLVACLDGGQSPDAPDTAQPDATEPTPDTLAETAEPDTVAPEVTPETVAPETVTPETVAPEVTPTGESFSLTLGGWTMEPGRETTRCIVVRLGNAERIWVPRIRTNLSKGSHHFVVYRSGATQERKEPFNCTPFVETLSGATVPLFISQTREESLELPPGVAFELEANQMIRLEAHYLNYYTEPITTEATVTFDTLPADEPPVIADFLFYGTTSINLGPGETVTNPWRFMPVPAGLQVFAMTGHTHQYGTNVEVEYTAPGADAALVYPPEGVPFKWSEAPIAYFDQPLDFDGSNGFNLRCSWTNTSDRTVGFGESANSEMCFFWAYYYPSQGFLLNF